MLPCPNLVLFTFHLLVLQLERADAASMLERRLAAMGALLTGQPPSLLACLQTRLSSVMVKTRQLSAACPLLPDECRLDFGLPAPLPALALLLPPPPRLPAARRQIAVAAVVAAEPALPDFMQPPPSVRCAPAVHAVLAMHCCLNLAPSLSAPPARLLATVCTHPSLPPCPAPCLPCLPAGAHQRPRGGQRL